MATLYAEIVNLFEMEEKCKKISEKNLECEILVENPTWNIPNYQRLYNWQLANFNKFIETMEELADIENQCSTKFFGQIILHINDDGNYDIVDGQQRLTTFMLLVMIILQSKSGKTPKTIKILEDFVYLDTDVKEMKFIHQLKNIDVIKSYVFLEEPKTDIESPVHSLYREYKNDNDITKYRNSLKKFYKDSREYRLEHYQSVIQGFDTLSKWYEELEYLKKLELVNNLTEGYVKISVMISSSFEMAYESFMTLNSEGRALTDYDLIKSFFIGEISNTTDHTEINAEWNQKIEVDKITNKILLDVLETLLKTKYNNLICEYNITINKKIDILSLLKRCGRGNGDLLYGIFNEYSRYIRFYTQMKSGNFSSTLSTNSKKYQKFNRSVESFISMNYVPFVPLMFDIISSDTLVEPEQVERAINLAKYAPFIYVTLFNQKPNKLTTIMDEYLSTTDKCISEKIDYMYEEFRDSLPRIDFKNQVVYELELDKKRQQVSKDILLLLETSISYNDKYMHHLEHIYPQTPEEGEWVVFEGNEKLKWNIGNHVIMPDYLNFKMSNKEYFIKKEDILQQYQNDDDKRKMSAYYGASDFVENYILIYDEFTPEHVRKRAAEYAEKLEKVFIDMGLLSEEINEIKEK